ncbi:putative csep0310 effector protein [Golovinomyces cichoracearum]|uniref:Putative csep0310 effector protein n=1 Tax=Golovinomyces cichoracearum TaxID=62708 RepID=A0A420HIH3_9PEZI|nr:putative csep0310 effector protein [Golovinomyces cichoracearum]
MSRRGIIPIFIATGIGIINGIWVFKPAFQESQRNTTDPRQTKDLAPTPNNESSAQAKSQNSNSDALHTSDYSTTWSSFTGWITKKNEKPPESRDEGSQNLKHKNVEKNQ